MRLGQRQTEAVALGGVGGIALIEFLEDALLRGLVHARSVIAHLDPHRAVRALAGNLDQAVRLGELDGVADEVDPDVGHHLLVAHVINLVEVQRKVDVLGLPLLLQKQNAAAQLLVQAIFRLVGDDLLVFQLGQEQDVAGHIGQTLGTR